jgi:SynChlorMet cassette radical SAM/SPASM protein ScmE
MRVMKTPRSVDISITNRCNLRCTYCSHFSSVGAGESDLPKSEWLSFFEELNRCAVLDVTLEGGEPFIRDDIQEIITGIVVNHMRFSLLSNATLITDEMAAFLAGTGRCNSVQVSIDGSTPETHDACRGNGNFERAVAGLKCLEKHDVPVTVRMTIHRHNVHDIEKTARFLLEDLEIPGFSTNAASHMGLCRANADDVQITVAERSSAMKTLLKLNEKYNSRISAQAGPLTEAKNWCKMEQARKENRDRFDNCGYLRSCGGVFSKLTVRANGVITPCLQMPHVELGQINEDDLRDVWENHPELIRLRRRRDMRLDDFEFCRNCDYIPYCRGGCPAVAYTLSGDENNPSPDVCLKRFLKAGGKLPKIPEVCYRLKLNHGVVWKLRTGSAALRPWVRRLSSIMELGASPSVNGDKEILFVQDNYESTEHTVKRGIPENGWKCHDLQAVTIWQNHDATDVICRVKSFSSPEMEITAMWNALYPIYLEEIGSGGMPFHAALLECGGRAVLLAAPSGTGKSTSCNRLPAHWNSVCDDETLVVVNHEGDFMAHPFPTWSSYLEKGIQRTWNVKNSYPVFGVFLMEQSDHDEAIPLGEGKTVLCMTHASAQIIRKYWRNSDKSYQRTFRNSLFNNACNMAQRVPAFTLHVNRHGRFWEEIERVLGW